MPDDCTVTQPVKPVALTVNPDGIPDNLKSLKQWCVWRYRFDGQRWKKPPFHPCGVAAKSNDRKTWADFDGALAAYQTGKFDGIGIFVAGQLTGIDLDHCVDDDRISEPANEILGKFSGYAERSPSGTGLRIFCTGKPQRSGKGNGANKWIEVYAEPSSRFLTVTGAVVRDAKVKQEQTALDWLHARYMVKPAATRQKQPPTCVNPSLEDAALLEKAHGAGSGARFAALWAGDTSGHGGDASAADLALCGMLAFWTSGDVDRIDRLFRQSGLMRDKWDSQRGESTYGQWTIEKAVADCRQFYSGRKPEPATGQPPKTVYTGGGDEPATVNPDPPTPEPDPPAWATEPSATREPAQDDEPGAQSEPGPDIKPGDKSKKWVSAADLLGMEFPLPIWLVPGLLPESGAYLVCGKPKVGKSWLAMQLGMSVAQGGVFLGQDVAQGGVLYLALEDTLRRLKDRMLKLQADADLHKTDLSRLAFRTVAPNLTNGLAKEIEASIVGASQKVRLVILDTLQKARGNSGTSGTQYGLDYEVLSSLKRIADDHGICLVVIHHLRKSESEDVFDMVSGSNGVAGAVDGTMVLLRQRNTDEAVLYVTGRDIVESEMGLRFDKKNCSWQFAGSAAEVKASSEQNEIVEALRLYGSKGATINLLCGDIGKKAPATRFLLRKLMDAGRVFMRPGKPAPSYSIVADESLVDCAKCNGTGKVGFEKANGKCFQCDGTGKVQRVEGERERERE